MDKNNNEDLHDFMAVIIEQIAYILPDYTGEMQM